MSYKKIILMAGLCGLFFGCSTGRFSDDALVKSQGPADTGMRYLLGRGVPQNNEKAYYYFNKAATQDDAFAQNELGYMHAAGIGTPRNYNKSFVYYQRAAHHGLASAQYNLGLLYASGLGTPPSRRMALVWFRRAAQHGFEPARIALEQYRG